MECSALVPQAFYNEFEAGRPFTAEHAEGENLADEKTDPAMVVKRECLLTPRFDLSR